MKKKELQLVRDTLQDELPESVSEAFSSLVYAVESAITHQMITESEIIPTFRKLLFLRKKGDLSISKLKEIKKEIREII